MTKKNVKPEYEQIADLIAEAQEQAKQKVLDEIVTLNGEPVTDDGEIIVDEDLSLNPKVKLDETLFISSADALEYAKSKNRKISPTKLSIGLKEGTLKLKNGNPVRSKQQLSKNGKPYRRTVHFGDFGEYIETLPKIKSEIPDEVINDYINSKEDSTDLIHREKETKHKESNPGIGQGYIRIARKISDHNA